LSESVTVTDVAPLLELTTGARGELVSPKMLAELPLSGRTSLMLVHNERALLPMDEYTARTVPRLEEILDPLPANAGIKKSVYRRASGKERGVLTACPCPQVGSGSTPRLERRGPLG
jgi:hypothetical protein